MTRVELAQQGRIKSVRGYRGKEEEDDKTYKEQSSGLHNGSITRT